ncbi:esterase/lipase family protein [Agromyces sp. NPDC058110]|uniref:esterase/lipase family protein n=1 Tax=Agromyces sp. NPDC058110 TaxID=3346345 RepID=UPI0036DC788C
MSGSSRRPSVFTLVKWTLLDELYAGWRQLAVIGGNRRSRAWRRGDDALPEVVLLPGVYEHWTFMRPLGNALNRAGHRVRVVRGLSMNRLPIAVTAARAVDALAKEPAPAAGRVFVAHSKGGLVAKHVLMDQEAAAAARAAAPASTTDAAANPLDLGAPPARPPDIAALGVVAICTPFAGSRYARMFVNRTMRDLRPDDETIVRLGGAGSVNARIVSVFGVFDPHVPEGSVLDGATNVRVQAAGHFMILRAPETAVAVVEGIALLARRAGDPPTTAG